MKSILLFILAMVVCLTVQAQTDYYTGREIVSGRGVAYRVEEKGGTYTINNITNTRMHKPWVYLDGTPVPTPYAPFEVEGIGDHKAMVKTILREVFAPSEIEALKNNNENFSVYYIVTPNGNIEEVEFMFAAHPLLYSITPDKWYALEQKIKQRLKYTWPDNVKNIKFISVFNICAFRPLFM